MDSVGERIKELREKRGWSQREFAKRLGISYSVVNRMELGKRPVDDHELAKIADLFDVTTDYLLGRSDSVYTKDEKEFLEDIDLPIETLMDKYNLTIDGEPATKEEIENIIAFIRTLRSTKKEKK
jgi:transcriptional regulator with XRE-family HTH domain